MRFRASRVVIGPMLDPYGPSSGTPLRWRGSRTSTPTRSGKPSRNSEERVCRTPEELKAWSQNLGHEDVMTTLRSYGEVPSSRQAEIIRSLQRSHEPDMDAVAAIKALETIVRRTTSGF